MKELKKGITTGTCAAAAARAAILCLFTGDISENVNIITPAEERLVVKTFPVKKQDWILGKKICFGVKKESGDDPDITNGTDVQVWASTDMFDDDKSVLSSGWEASFCIKSDLNNITVWLDGGIGIGRVAKPGLEQEIGFPAINKIPRKMIFDSVTDIAGLYTDNTVLYLRIVIPEGEKLAQKTLNSDLGIEGGLSVLGTTGILEPMSAQALIDTIRYQIRQKAAETKDYIILAPGNYGLSYVEEKLKLDLSKTVKCSNYIGDAIDFTVEYGFDELVLVGNIGKLCKIALGTFNTHSHVADGRREVFKLHAYKVYHEICCKADCLNTDINKLISQIDKCINTDGMLEKLKAAGLMDAVVDSMMEEIKNKIIHRTKGGIRVKVLVFSEKYGPLGEVNS